MSKIRQIDIYTESAHVSEIAMRVEVTEKTNSTGTIEVVSQNVDTITINGEKIDINNSGYDESYTYHYNLTEGENKFVIIASNEYGYSKMETVSLEYIPLYLQLEMEEPKLDFGRKVCIQGMVYGNCLAQVDVNGSIRDVHPRISQGEFFAEVLYLEDGLNVITVTLTPYNDEVEVITKEFYLEYDWENHTLVEL